MRTEPLPEEHFFDTRDDLFSSLADFCAGTLQAALTSRNAASIIVSGGSTPEPLYTTLAHTSLPWEKVTVALVDERWVDTNHAASNERFVRQVLLRDAAAQAKFIGMKNSADNAQAAVEEVNRRYDAVPSPFDLVILGMGPDGHTASLFPDAEGLSHALDANSKDNCCAITAHQSPVTGEHTERMTLTLHGIMQARQLVLLITGDEKLKIYQHALHADSHNELPVSAVLQQQRVPVVVYWAP